ncbi:hypothetical protein [Lysobacter niastensis]|uniref:hypothetical protein n=1 Tax=Lysobacter niastensis TaxID=380629 RepID=UPI001892534D|nr:hypothetical protein [Lysobacter niastensis]
MAFGIPGEGRRHWLKAQDGSAFAASVPGVWAGAIESRSHAALRTCSQRARDLVERHPRSDCELTAALTRRGYSDTDIGLVPGGNSRRLRGDVLG